MIVTIITIIVVLVSLPNNTEGLPCLTHASKAKFDAQRKALQSLVNDITNRVKKMDTDMTSLMADFKKREWKKNDGHCYYFGTERLTWFMAERRCKQIGGYLAVVSDSTENKWIFDNMPKKESHWNGMTDLKEGDWRWSYDQSLSSYKPWYSGYGSKGTSYNCALMYSSYTWLDYPCHYKYRYVCESNFCY